MTSRTDKEIARILKSGGPASASAQFMRRYEQTQTPRYLSEAAKLSSAFAGQPDHLNALITNVSRTLFVDAAKLGADRIAKIRFANLAPGYFAGLEKTARQLDLGPGDIKGGGERVLIVAKQMLGHRHAPTLAVLENARRLKVEAGAEVLVLDARDYPRGNALNLDRPFIANFREQQGRDAYTYQGIEIPVHYSDCGAYGRGLFQEWIDVAENFAPTVVLSQSSENFAGDLLSWRYPAVFIPSQQDEPLSRAHVVTDRFGQFGPGHRRIVSAQRHVKQLGQPRLHCIGQPSRDYNTQPFL